MADGGLESALDMAFRKETADCERTVSVLYIDTGVGTVGLCGNGRASG